MTESELFSDIQALEKKNAEPTSGTFSVENAVAVDTTAVADMDSVDTIAVVEMDSVDLNKIVNASDIDESAQ